jgi:hypothetical protein
MRRMAWLCLVFTLPMMSCGLITYQHDAGAVTGDTTWKTGTHNVLGSITVSGGVLTIEAGSTVKMAPGAILTISDGGALKLAGKDGDPVKITSANATPAAGDWGYIEIRSTADHANSFEYAIIEYGGSGYGQVYVEDGATVSITHSQLSHSADHGLELKGKARLPAFTDNTLTDNALEPVRGDVAAVAQLGAGTYTPNAKEGILVDGSTLETDATWKHLGVPYTASGTLSLTTDTGHAQLTLEAGVTLKMAPATSIIVQTNGALTLAGTAAAPVKITSSKPNPAAGDWTEIDLYGGAVGGLNTWTHAVVEYGGTDSYGMVWMGDGASLSLTDSTLQNAKGIGLEAAGDGAKLPSFTGNTIKGCGTNPIKIGSNEAHQLNAGTFTPNGVEAIWIRANGIDHDATWHAVGVPYRITNQVTVDGSGGIAHWDLDAGVTLQLASGIDLTIGNSGLLRANGTAAAPINITSTSTSQHWGTLYLNSAGNILTSTNISYGASNNAYGQVWLDGAAVTVALTDVTFANSGMTNACSVVLNGGTASGLPANTECSS